MAGIESETWTVLIVADDRKLHRVYDMSPDTKLSHVMQSWRDDCRLFGSWTFTSINGDTEYDIRIMTLEMIGEMSPNTSAVTLKAQLANKKGVSKISVYSEGEFADVAATQSQKLFDVLWRVNKGISPFANEGAPLDLKKTIKETGLTEDSVLYETQRHIEVKLSTGVTRTIEMDADSLVYQLIERVSFFEIDEQFSLVHRGRQLELYENVKDLKQVVEVTRSDFVVSFKYRRVSLQTSQSVKFSDFLSLLSVKAQMNKQDLEDLKYYCTGCQRCICKSDNEEYDQIMQTECCMVKSLSLVAKPACETSAKQESEDKFKFIYGIYSSLLRTATKNSRDDYKKLKSRLTERGIDFNEVAKWTKELRKIISDYEIKIKVLEEENKKLYEDLKATNEALKARNVDLDEERIKNVDLEQKMKKRLETLEVNMTELLEESKANNETMKAKTTNLETNVTKLLEESATNNEMMKAKATNLETNVTKIIEIITRVKLFVVYWDKSFSAVASRPELQSRGRCSNDGRHYIRCEVADLRPGWSSFEAVRAAVGPFFTGPVIPQIDQRRGSVDGRDVAQVTTLADNEESWDPDCYCSHDGREFRTSQVKDHRFPGISEGGRIFIPGGGRRAILILFA